MSVGGDDPAMDAIRFGSTIRAIRRRQRLTQRQLGARAGISDVQVSRIERGHVQGVAFGTIQRVAAGLDIRVDLLPRWRGGDLDRLLNAAHSALHESVARWFARRLPNWIVAPEVSFSIYGERGVIDVLAYLPERRALAVIELKTAIVDVNELLGTLDRKRRLAPRIARDRGWLVESVGTILIVAETSTNRRRIAAHAGVLRAALPTSGRSTRAWLRVPADRCDGIVLWPAPSRRTRDPSGPNGGSTP